MDRGLRRHRALLDLEQAAGPGQQRLGQAREARHVLASGELPPPLQGEQAALRCKACSLQERCQPQATHAGVLAARAALFDPDA